MKYIHTSKVLCSGRLIPGLPRTKSFPIHLSFDLKEKKKEKKRYATLFFDKSSSAVGIYGRNKEKKCLMISFRSISQSVS